jgi:hypothetical protein
MESSMKSYFILCILFLVSCSSNTNTQNTGDNSLIEEVKAKLDTILTDGVLKTLETKEHLEYPDIPLNESFMTIMFMVNPKDKEIYFSDSTVDIYYNVFNNYDFVSLKYKGMLDINGYNVAIFDFGNFGDRYYNIDSLKQISLDKFKPYPMKVICMLKYYVHNGKLYYWNP